MRKAFTICVVVMLVLMAFAMTLGDVSAAKKKKVKKKDTCTTIQDGVLKYSAGHYLEGEKL